MSIEQMSNKTLYVQPVMLGGLATYSLVARFLLSTNVHNF